jgi:hypothetical protein
VRTSSAERFCSAHCAEYVPLPPRKPDGEWFIVVGPMVAASPLRRASDGDF